MTREYIATANTVDEAIEIACKELGVSPEECSPEILQMPKKGFFGKVKQQAKVRVVIETMDSVRELLGVSEAAAPAPAPEKPAEKKEAPAPKKEAPKKEAAPAEKKPAPKKAAPAPKKETPAPVKETAPADEEAPKKEEAAPVPPTEEEIAEIAPKIELARAYLTEIFEKMGIEGISMEFTQTEGRTVVVHLDGEAIGSVIGKRGETLDAVQYLVCLAANRLEGEYVRFTMNAGNYREKREETLKALAQRMAKKVLKTGRPAALEPMNPYERRIIHAVITDIDGVFSKSTGEEPNRKVVIKPTSRSGGPSRERGERSERGESRSRRGGRGGYDRGERRSAPAEASAAEKPAAPVAPREKLSIDDGVKLYGKIELD
ncbi:MAG: protein jag [Oscillospiraceae bacterium]|nr:protein jag [Oscillospiraceae bacterium]